MKLLKVLIGLAIISIGISGLSSANATPIAVAFVSGELKTTGIGQIDFGLTYEAGAATTTTNPTITATNNGALLAFIQGASITNAKQINSYMLAQAAGGDVAESQLDVDGIAGAGGAAADASVRNYNMYGYVTPNLAYAGQYADSISGEQIDMNSQSWNKGALLTPSDQGGEVGSVAPGTIQASYLGGTYAIDASSVGQGLDRAIVFPATGTQAGESYAEKYATNKNPATVLETHR